MTSGPTLWPTHNIQFLGRPLFLFRVKSNKVGDWLTEKYLVQKGQFGSILELMYSGKERLWVLVFQVPHEWWSNFPWESITVFVLHLIIAVSFVSTCYCEVLSEFFTFSNKPYSDYQQKSISIWLRFLILKTAS